MPTPHPSISAGSSPDPSLPPGAAQLEDLVDLLAAAVVQLADAYPITPKDHGTGEKNYSRSFCCWAEDLNGDGYPDLIVIDFPGLPCYWMENPKGDPNKTYMKGHFALQGHDPGSIMTFRKVEVKELKK